MLRLVSEWIFEIKLNLEVNTRMETPSDCDLLKRLPGSWSGLFKSLMNRKSPWELATAWYQDATESQYGHKPVWRDVLNSLTVNEPVLTEKEELQFTPRLLLFNPAVQKNFLVFLLRNIDSVPSADIRCFIKRLYSSEQQESWLCEHLRLIHQFSQISSDVEEVPFSPVYQFTSVNQARATNIISKLKQQRDFPCTSNSDPWQSSIRIPNKFFQEIPLEETGVGKEVAMETDNASLTPETINLDDSSESPPAKVPRLDVTMETLNSDVVKSSGVGGIQFSQTREETLDNLKDLWESNSSSQCEGDLEIFLNFTTSEMDAACERLGLSSMSEDSLATACSHIATAADVISYNNCVKFLTFALLEKVKDMAQNASRTLASIVTLMAETFPKQLIDSVLMSIIQDGIESPQADLVCKVLKETMATTGRSYFFQKLLEKEVPVSDCTLTVLQTLVDKKCELESDGVSKLVALLHGAAFNFDKNLKFGKLLIAVVNTYRRQLTVDSIALLQNIVDRHNTFMKKSLQAAVKKIKPN